MSSRQYSSFKPIHSPQYSSPQQARASWLSRLHDHTQTHHIWQDSSGQVISPTQRLLPDNTQHSQQTDIHAPGRIRTHKPSMRAAADLRLQTARSLGPALNSVRVIKSKTKKWAGTVWNVYLQRFSTKTREEYLGKTRSRLRQKHYNGFKIYVGQVQRLVTGWRGRGSNTGWGEIFPQPPRGALGPIYIISRGGKAARAWHWPPTPYLAPRSKTRAIPLQHLWVFTA